MVQTARTIKRLKISYHFKQPVCPLLGWYWPGLQLRHAHTDWKHIDLFNTHILHQKPRAGSNKRVFCLLAHMSKNLSLRPRQFGCTKKRGLPQCWSRQVLCQNSVPEWWRHKNRSVAENWAWNHQLAILIAWARVGNSVNVHPRVCILRNKLGTHTDTHTYRWHTWSSVRDLP